MDNYHKKIFEIKIVLIVKKIKIHIMNKDDFFSQYVKFSILLCKLFAALTHQSEAAWRLMPW